MRSILRLALLFLLLLITVRSVSSESTVPFIYYYSYAESAFFIESADGIWRRTLTYYQVPQDHFGVLGPGWSPSGRWFAWFTYKLYGDFDMVNEIHIVSRSGKETKKFGSLGLITGLSWSPVEDLLYFEEGGGYGPKKAYMYNAEQDKLTELKEIANSPSSLQKTWSPDGNYLLRTYAQDGKTYIQVFLKDGKLYLEREIYIAGDEGAWEGRYYSCIRPDWTPHSDLMYMSNPDELIIEELATGLKQSYEFSDGTLGWVDWSPDGNYALIFKVQECLGSHVTFSGIWLLSRPDIRMIYLSNVSITPSVFNFGGMELWTSNSQRFVYVDVPGNIMVVEVPSLETEVLLSVPDEQQPVYQTYELYWLTNEDLVWVDRYWTLNHYNINSGLESTQLGDYSSGYHIRFSPNFEHVAVYDNSCGHTCIVSLTENPQTILELGSPDNRNLESTYYWHEDSDWLFVVTQNSGIFVVDIENRIVREAPVSQFNYSPAQFGWLPDVAD
ncbi:MAG: hypothetical protein L0154_21305 [Chloroflexi bacterium]|nr:hypothetical protein [Chloroflexota bacterium]